MLLIHVKQIGCKYIFHNELRKIFTFIIFRHWFQFRTSWSWRLSVLVLHFAICACQIWGNMFFILDSHETQKTWKSKIWSFEWRSAVLNFCVGLRWNSQKNKNERLVVFSYFTFNKAERQIKLMRVRKCCYTKLDFFLMKYLEKFNT